MKTELVLNIQSPTFLSWKASFKVDIAKMSPNPGSISLQMDRVDSISVGASAHMSDIAFKQLEVSVQQKLFSQPARKEVKGPFGQIIADYKKKVEKIRGKNGGRLLFLFAAKSFFFAAYCNIWDQPTTGELEILDLVVRTKVLGLKNLSSVPFTVPGTSLLF